MKTRICQFLFVLLCTTLAAAAQDMLPAFGGAKAPLLLALALHWAFTEPAPEPRDRDAAPAIATCWAGAALFAGAFEDALSAFPLGCATGFFLLAGVAARALRPLVPGWSAGLLGLVALAAVAPLHEVWLAVWGVTDGELVVRFFASALPAAPTGALVFALLPACERAVGFRMPKMDGRRA